MAFFLLIILLIKILNSYNIVNGTKTNNWLIGSGGVIIALIIIKNTKPSRLYCLRKSGVNKPIIEPKMVITGS